MKRFFLGCLVGLVVFVSLAGGRATAQADEPVRICRPNNMVSTLLRVAEQKNYFRDAGINVVFQETTNAKISTDALLAGHADAMGTVEAPLVYVGLGSLGAASPPLVLIAAGGGSPETALVGRKDAGVATLADIRGKRVGYLPGTVSYMLLARLLDKTGLTMRDITLVPLQPPAMPHALKGGAVDAFVMWEPWADQAVKALGEDKIVRLRYPELYTYKTLFVVTKDFAHQHPEKVTALLKALLRAEAFVKAHPEETMRLMSEAIKLDEAILRKNWKDYDFTVGLDDSILTMMREDARYVIRDDPNFAGKAIPDFSRYIEQKFLREVVPERVRLP